MSHMSVKEALLGSHLGFNGPIAACGVGDVHRMLCIVSPWVYGESCKRPHILAGVHLDPGFGTMVGQVSVLTKSQLDCSSLAEQIHKRGNLYSRKLCQRPRKGLKIGGVP